MENKFQARMLLGFSVLCGEMPSIVGASRNIFLDVMPENSLVQFVETPV